MQPPLWNKGIITEKVSGVKPQKRDFLSQGSAAALCQCGQNLAHDLLGVRIGEGAIVCTQFQREGHGLLALGHASAGKLLRNVKLFDIYRGTGVPEGKKSMAFSLELRSDERTLTDADSEQAVSKVLAALAEKLGATLR